MKVRDLKELLDKADDNWDIYIQFLGNRIVPAVKGKHALLNLPNGKSARVIIIE